MNHPNRSKRSACHRPSADEIKLAQEQAGLTDARCAELVCVSEVTWKLWASGATRMPAGAWKLFRLEVGLLDLKR